MSQENVAQELEESFAKFVSQYQSEHKFECQNENSTHNEGSPIPSSPKIGKKKKMSTKKATTTTFVRLDPAHGINFNDLPIYEFLSDHKVGATMVQLEKLVQKVTKLKCQQFGIILIVDLDEKPKIFKKCFSLLNRGAQNKDGTPMFHSMRLPNCDFLILFYPYSSHPSLYDWEENKSPSGKTYIFSALERKTFSDHIGNQKIRVKIQKKRIIEMKPFVLPFRAGFLFELCSLRRQNRDPWSRISGAIANCKFRDDLDASSSYSLVDTCFLTLKNIIKCWEFGAKDLALLTKQVPSSFPCWWKIIHHYKKKYVDRNDLYGNNTNNDNDNDYDNNNDENKSEIKHSNSGKNSQKEKKIQEQLNEFDIQQEDKLKSIIHEIITHQQNESMETAIDTPASIDVKEQQNEKKSLKIFEIPTLKPLSTEFHISAQVATAPKLSIFDQNSPENIWYNQLLNFGNNLGPQGALAIMNRFPLGFPDWNKYISDHGKNNLIKEISNLRRLENLETFYQNSRLSKQKKFKEGKRIGKKVSERVVNAYCAVRYHGQTEISIPIHQNEIGFKSGNKKSKKRKRKFQSATSDTESDPNS